MAVAGAVRAALDRSVGRNWIWPRIALVRVRPELNRQRGLAPRHRHVRDPERAGTAEVGVELAGGADAVDVVGGEGVEREGRYVVVPADVIRLGRRREDGTVAERPVLIARIAPAASGVRRRRDGRRRSRRRRDGRRRTRRRRGGGRRGGGRRRGARRASAARRTDARVRGEGERG